MTSGEKPHRPTRGRKKENPQRRPCRRMNKKRPGGSKSLENFPLHEKEKRILIWALRDATMGQERKLKQ